MTDLAESPISGIEALPPGAVPGATVRALVTWTESEIDQLLRQLDDAEREAAAAEHEADRLAEPALAPAGPLPPPPPPSLSAPPAPTLPPPPPPVYDESGEWLPIDTGMAGAGVADGPSDYGPEEAPVHRPSPTTGPPRTTVVVRPRTDGAATAPTAAAPGSPIPAPYQPAGSPSHRRARSGWLGTHLMVKAGAALVLMGLLLLKFG